jgi:hypothetical protein
MSGLERLPICDGCPWDGNPGMWHAGQTACDACRRAWNNRAGWVRVNEKFPPVDVDMPVVFESGTMMIARLDLDSGHWYAGYDKLNDPVWYLPLPQPPEVQ